MRVFVYGAIQINCFPSNFYINYIKAFEYICSSTFGDYLCSAQHISEGP